MSTVKKTASPKRNVSFANRYSFDQYSKILAEEKRKFKTVDFRHLGVGSFEDPTSMALSALYLFMRHIIYKLATNQDDINEAAYAERAFECAMKEMPVAKAFDRMQLGGERQAYSSSNPGNDPFFMMNELTKAIGNTAKAKRTISQTLNVE